LEMQEAQKPNKFDKNEVYQSTDVPDMPQKVCWTDWSTIPHEVLRTLQRL